MTIMATRPPSTISPKEIVASLRSVSTTHAYTFEALQALLGYEPRKSERGSACPIKDGKRNTSCKSQGRAGLVGTTRKTQAKQSVRFEIYESPANEAKALSYCAKRKLATESFNAALKCLTVAAKAKQDVGLDTSKTSAKRSEPSSEPLEQSSPNKRSKSPPYGCSSEGEVGDVGAVADCAIVSLNCLHDLKPQDDIADTGETGLQKGALILLDRLITLGYARKALTQVSKICEQYWKRRKAIMCSSSCNGDTARIPLIIDDAPLDKSDFEFVSSYQSQALRLCITEGSKAIDNRLLKEIPLQVKGSPGRVVLDGLKHGFICKVRAGNHLRTIAQALLRLHSVATSDKNTQDEYRSLTFNVLVEALNIKCESWSLLNHKLDVDREFWSLFSKGLLRLGSSHGNITDTTLAKIVELSRSASSGLHSHGFNAAIPANVVNKIIDIAEAIRCFDTGYELLQSLQSDARRWAPEQQVYRVWRMATMYFKCEAAQDVKWMGLLRETSRSFTSIEHTDINHFEDMLLHGARFRKSIISFVMVQIKSPRQDIEVQSEHALVEHCIRILSDLSELTSKLLLSSNIKADLQIWKSGYVNFAKTFESILEMMKVCSGPKDPYTNRSFSALSSLITSAKDLMKMNAATVFEIGEEVTKFLESLISQTSNLYWIQYVETVAISPQHDGLLGLLELTCDALQGLSARTQRSAAYGTKLEKLALSHLIVGDQSAACQVFETEVIYHIKLGALDEAAESALSGSNQDVWSRRRAKSYCLSQALRSLTKLRLTYNINRVVDNTWIYDDVELPPVERTLLFECQLNASSDHDFSNEQATICRNQFQLLLEECQKPELQVYRLRFLSGFLCVASKNCSLFETVTLAVDLILPDFGQVSEQVADTPLSQYYSSTRWLLELQFLMLPGRFEVGRLRQCVKSIYDFIIALPDAAALRKHIDSPDFLVRQLKAVVDLGRMMDDSEVAFPGLLSLKHILSTFTEKNTAQLIETLTELAKLYYRTGRTIQAGKAFTAIEMMLDEIPEGSGIHEIWALSYVEYLVDMSNMTKAIQVYSRSMASRKDRQAVEEQSGRQHLERHFLTGRAALVASGIALHQGNPHVAYQFAKQAIKLSSEIWHTVEKRTDRTNISFSYEAESSIHNLTTEMSSLNLSFEQPLAQRKPQGNAYWAYLDLHYSTLLGMINLSMHTGLYQDSIYYAEQLRKMSEAIGSAVRLSRATAILALVKSRAGHEIEVADLTCNYGNPERRSPYLEDQYTALWQAEACMEVKDYDTANSILETVLKSTTPIVTTHEISKTSQVGLKKAPVRGRAKSTRPIKTPAKRPGQTPVGTTSNDVYTTQIVYTSRRQQYIQTKRQSLQDQIALSQGLTTLRTIRDLGNDHEAFEVSVTSAMILLSQAMSEFSSDAVKCVLAETAVALPVKYKSSRKSGRVSFVRPTRMLATAKSSNSRVRGAVGKTIASRGGSSLAENHIAQAQKLLRCLETGEQLLCTSDTLHLAHRMQSKLGLLSSTMDVPFSVSSSELVFQSLTSKDIVREREQLTVNAERQTRTKAQILAWPDIALLSNTEASDTIHNCNMDDLAEIPQLWSVITVSLTDDEQELLMSKTIAGRSPFLLRIPLSRSDIEVDEEAEFSFSDARAEITDIIASANASAHDARGQGDRETRRAWYAEREDLDTRLEAWLYNIENIWLGGFRGLMSPSISDDEMLVKFGRTLNQILDNHLPSRQKSSSSAGKVALHAHVLELFLGLGHPDTTELDDAATDLLYFVVDILQFSGEHNAYDEVDFDAMLVDVLDALRTCHGSICIDTHNHHTILIVDKELASFPWESLPCLQDRSVSRMPSLSSLVERLRKIHAQSPTATGYTIPTDNGAYILNPSSDLTSTQSTFQPILESQLSGYTSKTNTKPNEAEFTSLLTSHSLLLYFGHGSGAQYIRGRTIRDLPSCAVTLLMGCSSAKMTECGKFESYGMPGYYINGMSGCMAVVGTLWDVTDRDIDRFAIRLMVEWGLVDGRDENVKKALEKKSKKTKGKGNAADYVSRDERRGKVSLDEAVRRGREACLLRYLNGAAPVVYGVPVFLE